MNKSGFYIKRVRIEKLFGYKDIEWNLNEDVNILGGINGSGKSTVINLITSYLESEVNTENYPEFYQNLLNRLDIEFYNGYVIHLIVDTDPERNTFDQFLKKYKKYDKIDVNPRLTGIEMFECNPLSFEKKGAIISFNGGDLSYSHERINFVLLSSAEHQIISDEIVKGIGDKNIKTTLDLSLFQEINKRNELVTNSSLKGGESFAFIQQLNNLLFEKLNFFFGDTHKSIAKDSSRFDVTTENGKTIDCYKLSTGEKQLLLILLTAFNSNSQPCIMLMDEPDLGIHIDWKKNLIHAIREINPHAQLILSTHSPSMTGGWFDKVKEMSEITINTN